MPSFLIIAHYPNMTECPAIDITPDIMQTMADLDIDLPTAANIMAIYYPLSIRLSLGPEKSKNLSFDCVYCK